MAGLRQLNNYVSATLQKRHRVLGVRLEPFCLGHLFLMQRFDIPFASDNPNAMGSPWDLMRAVTICCRTYEQAVHFIYKESYQSENVSDLPLALWNACLDKVTGTSYTIRWFNKWDKKLAKGFKAKGGLDAFEEFEKFREYRQTDLYEPYFYINSPTGGKQSGAHWSMNVYQLLTKELHYTKSEALNMPLAQAMVEYYKGLESLGCITLMDDFDCAVAEGTVQTLTKT